MQKPFLMNFAIPLTSDVLPPLPPYNPAIQGREKVLSDSIASGASMAGTRNYTTKHQLITGWEDWDG